MIYNLKNDIKFVLKQVSPSLQISKDGLDFMNTLLNNTIIYILNTYGDDMPFGDIINNLISENALKEHALIEQYKTLQTYEAGETRNLVFGNISFYEDKESSLSMATFLEYLTAEILELSEFVTRDNRKIRIKQDYIKLAILKDKELKEFFDKIGFKSSLSISSKKSTRRKTAKKNTRRKTSKKSTRRKTSKKSTRRKTSKKSTRRKIL